MKRLLIMTHNMAGGGCERVIAQLANRFADWGIACTIVTEYACESFYPLDARVRLMPLLPGGACPSRCIPRAYLALRRLVRRERPDVVLAMPEKVNVWTVLFLLGSGVPVAVSERNDPRRRLHLPDAGGGGLLFPPHPRARGHPEKPAGRGAPGIALGGGAGKARRVRRPAGGAKERAAANQGVRPLPCRA